MGAPAPALGCAVALKAMRPVVEMAAGPGVPGPRHPPADGAHNRTWRWSVAEGAGAGWRWWGVAGWARSIAPVEVGLLE